MVVLIVKAAIQILAITFFLYFLYVSFADSKAQGLIKVGVIYIILYFVCYVLELDVLLRLLELIVVPMITFCCVMFQPEIRRAFVPGFANKRGLFNISGGGTSALNVEKIVNACTSLVESKRGALIVFPRKVSIKNIIESGTALDSEISSELIVTIFNYDTALHDGAMIIQGSRIIAAGCYLPLSVQSDIKQSFGTRHRAALGMAEESDAVVMVVSEETGAMSLAYNGRIYYDLKADIIKNTLVAVFNNQDIGSFSDPRSSKE